MPSLVTYRFVVDEQYTMFRADKFLAMQLPEISRNKIKQLMELGNVILNGNAFSDCSYKVQVGDNFTINISEEKGEKIEAKNIPFEIVYEDKYLLVINKPAGLTVHPGTGNRTHTLVNALLHYCGDSLSSILGNTRPGIVHRLDKDTSGLMVVAKSDIIHSKLARALTEHNIKRTYHALVYGVPTPIAGKITANVGRSKRNHKIMTTLRNGGKVAVTHFRVLKVFYNAVSLVECQLETGRTHQIRVHMLHRRTPVVGDQTYGKGLNFNISALPFKAQDAIFAFQRQALHAFSLDFMHPVSSTEMNLTSCYPEDFENALKTLTAS